MADNTMVIVCEICHPNPVEWSWGPGIFPLAKYFYTMKSREMRDGVLADWMREHLHGVIEIAAMPVHFSLQFESREVWAERGEAESAEGISK